MAKYTPINELNKIDNVITLFSTIIGEYSESSEDVNNVLVVIKNLDLNKYSSFRKCILYNALASYYISVMYDNPEYYKVLFKPLSFSDIYQLISEKNYNKNMYYKILKYSLGILKTKASSKEERSIVERLYKEKYKLSSS